MKAMTNIVRSLLSIVLLVCAGSAQASTDMRCLVDNEMVEADDFAIRMTRTTSQGHVIFTHPADGEITLRLTGNDVRPLSRSDRTLLDKDRQRRINRVFDHYATRSDVVAFLPEPERRWSWGIDVRPTDKQLWQFYVASRVADGCIVSAVIEYPREYAATSYPGRLMTLFHQAADRSRPDDLDGLLREDVDRPTGGRALLYGIALPLGIGILVALMNLSSRKFSKVYFSLYDRIVIAVLPVAATAYAVIATISVVSARVRSDGIELAALGVIVTTGMIIWVFAARHHQIAYLAFLLSSPLLASAVYWERGWAWNPQDLVFLGSANLAGAAIAAFRTRVRLDEIRVREHRQKKETAALTGKKRT